MTTTTTDHERHKAALTQNARNWLQTDFELLNTVLDIELNSEISPIIMLKVIKDRLDHMSKEERKGIPAVVWEYIEALDVLNVGLRKYNPLTPPVGQENKSGWFSVQFQCPDVFHIVPRNCDPKKLLASLKIKDRFSAWMAAIKPEIQVDADRIYFSSPTFDGLSTKFFKTVIESF